MKPSPAPLPLFALAVALHAPAAFGQAESEFAELLESAQTRIERSMSEYQDFLSANAEQRIELTTRINRLENELVALRSQARDARSNALERSELLKELKERSNAYDASAQYSLGVLSEYLSNFESRLHVAEDQIYAERLLDLRNRLEQAGEESDARLPVFFEAIEAGLARQEALVGGTRFAGRAITPEGGVKRGEVLLVGPSAFFRSEDGSAAGALAFNSGTIEPGLLPFEAEQGQSLQSLLAGSGDRLPLDASLGSAFELKRARGTVEEHIRKGGWVGYAILALGLSSLLIGALKAFDLRGSRVPANIDTRAIALSVARGDAEAAKQKADAVPGPAGPMLATGVDFARADSETLLEAMDTVILRHQPKLERFLPFLATTAAVAPLMGLLGTVVGMIKTFTLIEVFGTGDARALSSGISEALVTTELGLIVAIPALILHGIFSRIMRSRLSALEQIATEFSRSIAAERNQVATPAAAATR